MKSWRRRWLSKWLVKQSCFAVLLSIFIATGVNAEPLKASEALTRLLSGFHSYQAVFAQTTLSAQGRLLGRSAGIFQMERPGRFRWETKEPTHQILITNNTILWIYDVDLEQATRQKISAVSRVNPASLLNSSPKALTEHFTVQYQQGRHATFLLKPKQPNQNFHSIQVSFKKGLLVKMEVLNALDELSLFEFSNIKVNSQLPSTLFDFKPGSNIDVVTQ